MVTEENKTEFAEKLRAQTCGVRFRSFGMTLSRKLDKDKIQDIATQFDADSESLTASKRILDSKHGSVRKVRATQRQAKIEVHKNSIDYPEKGLRLIKTAAIEAVTQRIADYKIELDEALQELYDDWDDIKAERQTALKELYSDSDYDLDVREHFAISIEFPAIEPDQRLMTLHPELYAAEQERIGQQFAEALIELEIAAKAELTKMLNHFVERLEPSEDGKKKTLTESTLVKLHEYAEYFKSQTIGSHADLDGLMAEISDWCQGRNVEQIRKGDPMYREGVKADLTRFKEAASALVIAKPRRMIDLD